MKRRLIYTVLTLNIFVGIPSTLYASAAQNYKIVLGSYATMDLAKDELTKLETKLHDKHIESKSYYDYNIVTRPSGKCYMMVIEPVPTKKMALTVKKIFAPLYPDLYINKYTNNQTVQAQTVVLTADQQKISETAKENQDDVIIYMDSNASEEFHPILSQSNAIESSSVHQQNTMFSLLQEAVKKSPSILSKNSNLLSAQYAVEGAKWQFYPTPSISYEQGKAGDRSTVFRLQQPLWAGGRIDAQYDKAITLADAAKMSINELKQTIAVTFSQTLNSIISSHGRILVYENGIMRLNEHKRVISRRIKSGISPESELLLVDARLAQAQTDISITKSSEQKGLWALEQLLTRSINGEELAPILPEKACFLPLPDTYKNNEFIQNVVAANPGLLRFQYQIQSATHDVEIKKASILPNVYAKVQRQWSDQLQNETALTMGVEYVPGAGLSSLSSIDAARAATLSLQRDKEQFELDLKQKANSELSDYGFTLERYENYMVSVESTRKTAESYKRLFIAGKRSWLDVLNAEREWMNAEVALNDIQAYLVTTPIRLKVYANEIKWQENAQ